MESLGIYTYKISNDKQEYRQNKHRNIKNNKEKFHRNFEEPFFKVNLSRRKIFRQDDLSVQ